MPWMPGMGLFVVCHGLVLWCSRNYGHVLEYGISGIDGLTSRYAIGTVYWHGIDISSNWPSLMVFTEAFPKQKLLLFHSFLTHCVCACVCTFFVGLNLT